MGSGFERAPWMVLLPTVFLQPPCSPFKQTLGWEGKRGHDVQFLLISVTANTPTTADSKLSSYNSLTTGVCKISE